MRTRRFPAAVAAMAMSLALLMSHPAHAGDLTDAQILAIYVQVNTFDIETALLGRAQAKSDAVRTLAMHVAADHTGVRQNAYALATQCGAPLELPPARTEAAIDHGKTLARLLALEGGDFDKAYLEHEVAFHRAAIDAVKSTLLPAAHCPALRAHLKEVLPAFEHHLAMTEALAAKSK